MKKKIVLLCIIFLIYSCEKKQETINSKETSSAKNKKQELKLDFFKIVPDTIDGCGEYYVLEKEKDDSQNYIFLSNLSSFAIIKVDGKDLFLEKDSINCKEISKNEYLETYKGNGFKAILKTKIIRQYDEGGFCKGALRISNKNEEIEYKIKGESGC